VRPRSNLPACLKKRFQREAHAIGATVPMLKLIERLFDRPAFAIPGVARELVLTHRGAAITRRSS
jgi:hypothetical protein